MSAVILMLALFPACEMDGTRFEGTVGVEGSEPFSVLVLYVSDEEQYVLELDEEARRAIQNGLPGRIAVVGSVREEETPRGIEKRLVVKDWHWIGGERNNGGGAGD